MSRVVHATAAEAGPRRLFAAPRDQLDPVVRDLVAAARAEAHERGLDEGRVHGAATAAAQVSQLTAAVMAAVEEVRRVVGMAREASVTEALELAVTIATSIVGAEPHDGGASVAVRVRETLAQLEDPAPIVNVSADDVAVVAAAVADHRAVVVEVDPTLGPGEARIRGGWADADLTRATAFAAIRRELGVDA